MRVHVPLAAVLVIVALAEGMLVVAAPGAALTGALALLGLGLTIQHRHQRRRLRRRAWVAPAPASRARRIAA
jgi:hypothetical protein